MTIENRKSVERRLQFCRAFLLMILPLVAAIWFSLYVSSHAQIIMDINKIGEDGRPDVTPEQVREKQNEVRTAIENLTPFVKLPISFLTFDAVVKNNILLAGSAEDVPMTLELRGLGTSSDSFGLESQKLMLPLRIGSATTTVETGREFVLSHDIKLESFLGSPFQIRFKVKDHNSIDLSPLKTKENHSTVIFYARPSAGSFFMVILSVLFILPGILLIVSSLYKFIRFGIPFESPTH